jgi:hypothetical protein
MSARRTAGAMGVYRGPMMPPSRVVQFPAANSYVMNGLDGMNTPMPSYWCAGAGGGARCGYWNTTYGSTAPSTAPTTTLKLPAGWESYLAPVTQVAAALTSKKDARVEIATLEARIANYEKMKVGAPFLAWFYNNEIAKMQAKVAALRATATATAEGEAATGTWRTLGQVGAGVGILAGVALAGYIIIRAVKEAKS